MNAPSLVHAAFLSFANDRLHQKTAGLKQALFDGLSGTVVEIGAGNGANIAILPKSVSCYIGVEPNPIFRKVLGNITTTSPLIINAVDGVAEQLPFEDGFADAIISTFVLCSVCCQQKAIAEVMRVLKSGGKFVFFEHIAAPSHTVARLVQRLCSPLSRRLCGGCQWHRDTGVVIYNAGFSETNMFMSPPLRRFSFAPTIAGYCIK